MYFGPTPGEGLYKDALRYKSEKPPAIAYVDMYASRNSKHGACMHVHHKDRI